jgi:phospholipid-binding lipoprotein MlaA
MSAGAAISALLAMATWHDSVVLCAPEERAAPALAQSEPPAQGEQAGPPAEQPASPPANPTEEQAVAQEDHIVVSGRRHARYDPLENANKVSFEVVQKVDKAVVGPVAEGYEHVVPEPVRDGVHNMVHNLREPYIAINFLLQHRVGKSAETVARF